MRLKMAVIRHAELDSASPNNHNALNEFRFTADITSGPIAVLLPYSAVSFYTLLGSGVLDSAVTHVQCAS
ncbi:MAG TPA: hypothetical protein PLU88_01775 [Armatimonadota bacterium]|nr:hypothetical protein [Armatimonadota bacterium]HPP73840.1 hypothetical protein [Armatimonadota bacterium]